MKANIGLFFEPAKHILSKFSGSNSYVPAYPSSSPHER